MMSFSGLMLVSSLMFVLNLVVCTRTLVASTTNGDMDMDMYVTVRKKRSRDEDFTVINRYICPPSLCRMYDEKSKVYLPRPKGTAGTIFFQGDIILDNKFADIVYKNENNIDGEAKSRKKRATMKPRRRLWRKGIIKYKFAKGISDRAKKALNDAMVHIEEHTCVKFEEKGKNDEHFIRFISEPGCWSQIGKVGGAQLVSLGSGCESLGTATHEIVHALGMWHEQARPDRKRFVNIREENISPKFMPDFETVDKIVASNRGYPYDYQSLMHYSKYAFTRNGKPTIQVIGKGRRRGLHIGQRVGLSTIDIAQLRDMYGCNFHTDVKESYCDKGWKQVDLSCYKFFPTTKGQFGPAATACKDLKSHLVFVDNKWEQRFLDKYLVRKFPAIMSWRIGIKRVNDTMIWFDGANESKTITWTNWAKDNPRKYNSAIMKRSRRRKNFKWYGEWLGSVGQRPSYEHPYICEKKVRKKCVPGNYKDGRDYRGTKDYTVGGHTCQKWTENYPRSHPLRQAALNASRSEEKTDKDGLGDHNYCRNPSSKRRDKPWCYTAKKKVSWAYCHIVICQKTIERFQRRQERRLNRARKNTRETAVRYRLRSSSLRSAKISQKS